MFKFFENLEKFKMGAISSVLGKLPSPEEYLKYMQEINPFADEIYRYLNFNEIESIKYLVLVFTLY